MKMRLERMALLLGALVPAVAMTAQAPSATYVEVEAVQQVNAETAASALAKKGFVVRQVPDTADGRVHLRMGPYGPAEAAKLRNRLAAAGYPGARLVEGGGASAAVSANGGAEDAAAERMRRMEAEANAKLGGGTAAASTPGDLEAQALAKLGLNNAAPVSGDMETRALAAMQANTAQAEVDAENLRQAQEIAAQQAEAARLQREIEQSQTAAAGPPQSTAANILNGLSAVIAGATASIAQNQANNDSINQALQQQQAKLRDMQQQIAAKQAAEQARQQQAAQQARQQAANQAQERAAAARPVAPPQAAVVQQPQRVSPSGPTSSPSSGPSSGPTIAGRCPNGAYRGGTYGGLPCDCRASSAAYNCPSRGSSSSTSSVKYETQVAGITSGGTGGSVRDSGPPSAVTGSAPVFVGSPNPSFSTQDTHGNVTLGTGSPKACATSAGGSQLPLTPGTIAGTCNPASCRPTGFSVRLESHWTDAKKTEVVGFFNNDSFGDATCTWAFHKHGVWTDEGQLYLKFHDQHKGGEFGGVWSIDTDSSDIKYLCFEGIDPVDVHGKLCNQGIVFSGPTAAGTDKE